MAELFTDEDFSRWEQDARKFQGAFTGTSGTLAGYVILLLGERKRLLEELSRVKGEAAVQRARHFDS